MRRPATNTDFGSAVLHAVTTDPRLESVRKQLVLKGGAALLLGYDSGRATRRDLDFDVRNRITITDADALALLDALREWNARYVPGKGGVRGGQRAQKITDIIFQDPRTRAIGQIEIQISKRNIPPVLAQLIAHRPVVEPLHGTKFDFPMLSLEAIAAEKIVRSYKHRDESGLPTLGPATNDMYDIGYIVEWARQSLRNDQLTIAFNLLCQTEAADEIVIEHERLDYLALRVYGAHDVTTLMGASGVLDRNNFEVARKRVLLGIKKTKQVAGLAPSLPPLPVRKR